MISNSECDIYVHQSRVYNVQVEKRASSVHIELELLLEITSEVDSSNECCDQVTYLPFFIVHSQSTTNR